MELFAAPDTSELKADQPWIGLISQLRQHKGQLVEDFKARFPAEYLYEEKVSSRELTNLIESTMEMYLVLLAGEQLSQELENLPFELGRRRARQGVPAEQLLEGVRTNSRVIWNALRQAVPADSLSALVRNTDAVLGLVEWHVRTVQSSFLREQEILARHNEHRRKLSLGKLFATPKPDPGEVTSIALDLGVHFDSAFDVIAEMGPHKLDCPVCSITERGVFFYDLPGGNCHFAASFLDVFTEFPAGRCIAKMSSVNGLGLVSDAARAGLSLLEARPPLAPESVNLDTAWPILAWKNLSNAVNPELLPINTKKLAALIPHERQRLLQTASTYFRTGSIKETAALHFCHRNTVVKRLARFEEITGANLSIPLEAALAILATSQVSAE